LEKLFIEAVYKGLLRGTVDQLTQTFCIEWCCGRQLPPTDPMYERSSAVQWLKKCNGVMSEIDRRIAQMKQESEQLKHQNEEFEKTLSDARTEFLGKLNRDKFNIRLDSVDVEAKKG
jgi:hypothetical protein